MRGDGTDGMSVAARALARSRRRAPRRRRGAAALLSVALVAATWTGLQATAPAATTPATTAAVTGTGAWGVLATTSGSGSQVLSLSCGTPATCLAASGTTLLRTTDGGAAWQPLALPSGYVVPVTRPGLLTLPGTQVRCSGASDCVLVAAEAASQAPVLLVTSDAGTTWAARPVGIAAGNVAVGAWCASVTRCTFESLEASGVAPALQLTIERASTTDGGEAWATTTSADPLPNPYPVVCATSTLCLGTSDSAVVPGLFVSTDGGGSFSPANGEPSASPWPVAPQGMACPSATTCLAVLPGSADQAVVTHDGGGTWSQVTLPGTLSSSPALSCGSALDCTAVSGPDAFTTSDGGDTWQALPAAPVTSLDAVSCPTTAGCLAAGTGTGGGVVVGEAPPTPAVGLPAAGATLHGSVWLDASTAGAGASATSVVYEVSGNGVSDKVVSGGTPTIVGVLGAWDTTDVPNGTYTVTCIAAGPFELTRTSAPVTVHVDNLPLAAAVLVPATGSVLDPGGIVDASAAGRSDVTAVTFALTGGTLADHPVATGTLTVYGWIGRADLASVPAGAYQLTATATDAAGHRATSPPVAVTVAVAVALAS